MGQVAVGRALRAAVGSVVPGDRADCAGSAGAGTRARSDGAPLPPRAPLHRAPTELGRPRTRRAADGGAPQAHGPAQWSGSSRRDGTAAQGRELVAGVSCAVSKPRAPNTA